MILNPIKKSLYSTLTSKVGMPISSGLQTPFSIIGLTPTGKATINTLALNWERVLNIRAADKEIGRHPPAGDRIQFKAEENS